MMKLLNDIPIEITMRKIYLYYILFGVIFAGVLIFFIKQESKVPFALEVDATKDTTDIAGTYYRIRVNNVGINSLSNISVYLGKNDNSEFRYACTRSIIFLLSKTRDKLGKNQYNRQRGH